MVIRKNVESLLVFALTDKVTRGFWDKPDESNLKDGGQSLKGGINELLKKILLGMSENLTL